MKLVCKQSWAAGAIRNHVCAQVCQGACSCPGQDVGLELCQGRVRCRQNRALKAGSQEEPLYLYLSLTAVWSWASPCPLWCQGPLPYNDSPGFRVADTLVSPSRPGRAGPLCSLGFKYAVRKRVEREEIIREGLEYKGNVQGGVWQSIWRSRPKAPWARMGGGQRLWVGDLRVPWK